jgi:biopolymer transport protein ExbD
MAKRKKFELTAEADMTPMIDMTFQLIAFFMILLNFAEGDQDQRIKLPSSELAKPPDTAHDAPLILQLTEKGEVLYAGDPVPLSDMTSHLRREAEILKRQQKSVADTSVIIRADRGTKTGLVQELIKKCQEQKFEKFSLRARQEQARAP